MPLFPLLLRTTLLAGLLMTTSGTTDAALPAHWQQTFSAVLELPSRPPDRYFDYGPSPEQRFSIWFPGETRETSPLVILIHGGCWLDAYDVGHVYPLASALADAGYTVAAPEYRRVGQDGGGWPGTFQDIGQALDRLAVAKISGPDPARAILVGHSAGGQLALWAAGRDRLDSDQSLYTPHPFTPRAVIGLAAITDLADYGKGQNSCQAVVPRLMGGGPADHPGRYAQASPAELGVTIPVVLLQGDQDAIVPPDQAKALPDARTRMISGAGHFDLIHPSTPAFAILIEELEKLSTP